MKEYVRVLNDNVIGIKSDYHSALTIAIYVLDDFGNEINFMVYPREVLIDLTSEEVKFLEDGFTAMKDWLC